MGNRASPVLPTSALARAFRFLPAASFSHVSPLPPPPLCPGVVWVGSGGRYQLSHVSAQVFAVGLHEQHTVYTCVYICV